MRYILLSYLSFCLFILSIFVLLSYGHGFGYVFMQWHNWQLQTNVFVFIVLLFITVTSGYLTWNLLKKIFRRYLQKYQSAKSFNKLHPYEQLGVLWLLHAEKNEQQHIHQTYKKSYALYPLIRTRLALAQQDPEDAKKWLKQEHNPLFEVAELLKIDVALLEKNPDIALNRLEFLSVQPLSSWLIPIQQTYKIELNSKWFEFAKAYPWYIFKSEYHPVFAYDQQQAWLEALIQHSQLANEDDWLLFKNWYLKNKNLIELYNIESKINILKLMSHDVSFDQDIIMLSEKLLREKFVPDLLYIWLGKQLKQHKPDFNIMLHAVEYWENQYTAQPSLSFAKWHIYQGLARGEEAQALLNLYPQDPYMAYLRLQNQVKVSEHLLNDLKLMMEYSKQDFSLDV